jgi:hypothetical protein
LRRNHLFRIGIEKGAGGSLRASCAEITDGP